MVVQTTPPTGGMVQTSVIGDCSDHATYRENGANTAFAGVHAKGRSTG